jgi:beta-lactam-binding protein with PASTA domain
MTLSDAEERCSFEAIDAPDLATAVRGPRERLRARMRPSASPAVGAKAMPTASPVVIAPGAKRVYGWAVRGPRHLIGWPVDHQIKIEVTVADQEPLPPLLVIFRQRPLIAWWLIPAILLLGALLLALYLIWPRKVDMPDMRGRTVNAAERQMVRTGLTAKPQVQRRVVPRVKAGTVVGQLPAPFARVGTGQKVIVTIAMPPAFTLIPDLRGYTWDRAEALLSHAHLKLGEVLPSKISLRKVIRQSPRAGRARSRGTAVDVVLAGPPLRVLPDVRCLTPKRAQAALERRGFRLKPVPEFLDPRKLSRSQTPPPHTRQRTGRQVQLFFTGAKPKRKPERCRALAAKAARAAAKGAIAGAVAFDDGHAVRLAGRPRIVGAGRQAAWSPDGALLALRSGPRIVIRRVGGALGSAAIATISTPGVVPSMPAFAPGARDRPVLAFLATRGTGTSSICLAAVVAGEVTPNCRQLPRIRGRALAWSPDAATILVTGARPELPDRSGVVRLTAVTPAAADGALWNVDRHLLRPRVGARRASVFDVAFEPSGATLALTTDVAASGAPAAPQIVLARADQELSLRGARWLGTPACQVAWSSDGARLAAVQSGDAAGCGSRPRLGRLVALALDEPHVLTEVTTRASRPAWRPAAAARGRDHP